MDRPIRQGWRSLLVAYGVTSTIEAIGVSQIFAYLPLRLREVGLPEADIPAFTGIFTSLIFVFGILLVPFWGVWADKYTRRGVIVPASAASSRRQASCSGSAACRLRGSWGASAADGQGNWSRPPLRCRHASTSRAAATPRPVDACRVAGPGLGAAWRLLLSHSRTCAWNGSSATACDANHGGA